MYLSYVLSMSWSDGLSRYLYLQVFRFKGQDTFRGAAKTIGGSGKTFSGVGWEKHFPIWREGGTLLGGIGQKFRG